jgi:hypothetical protein
MTYDCCLCTAITAVVVVHAIRPVSSSGWCGRVVPPAAAGYQPPPYYDAARYAWDEGSNRSGQLADVEGFDVFRVGVGDEQRLTVRR